MQLTPDQVAHDWIEYQRYENPKDAPDEIRARGWLLYELSAGHPEFAWEVIKLVVGSQSEDGLFSDKETESQWALSNLGAGPLEDLLSRHGNDFIERIENEARGDRRFFWMLGCVWQSGMPDDLWGRVQKAAGGISR